MLSPCPQTFKFTIRNVVKINLPPGKREKEVRSVRHEFIEIKDSPSGTPSLREKIPIRVQHTCILRGPIRTLTRSSQKLKAARNGLEPGIDSDVAKLIVDDRHFGFA